MYCQNVLLKVCFSHLVVVTLFFKCDFSALMIDVNVERSVGATTIDPLVLAFKKSIQPNEPLCSRLHLDL